MSGRLIALEQAAAGMVLAEALCDANGALLLPAGATLSAAALAALRRRGVASCSIAAPGEPAPPESVQAQAATQRLQHLFRRSGEADAMPPLLRLLNDYRAPK